MIYLGPDELGAERAAEALPSKLRYSYLNGTGGAELSLGDESHAFYEADLALALRNQPGLNQEAVKPFVAYTDAINVSNFASTTAGPHRLHAFTVKCSFLRAHAAGAQPIVSTEQS